MTTTDILALLSLLLAGMSLLFSVYTLWVTQLRRGQLKMTQPTLLCFTRESPSGLPKIFLRTLLYSTATKGRVIESMFLKIHHSVGTHIFDFWGYGETENLTVGSGLFVGPEGIAYNHHFNPHHGSDDFLFVDGKYRIEVFATLVGGAKAEKLCEITFILDSREAAELIQITDLTLFLYWNVDTSKYDVRLEHPSRPGIAIMNG